MALSRSPFLLQSIARSRYEAAVVGGESSAGDALTAGTSTAGSASATLLLLSGVLEFVTGRASLDIASPDVASPDIASPELGSPAGCVSWCVSLPVPLLPGRVGSGSAAAISARYCVVHTSPTGIPVHAAQSSMAPIRAMPRTASAEPERMTTVSHVDSASARS